MNEYDELVKAAKRQGWSHDAKRKGYPRLLPPGGGKPVILPRTPSDVKAVRNTIAFMRRKYGFQWPPPSKKELRSARKRRR